MHSPKKESFLAFCLQLLLLSIALLPATNMTDNPNTEPVSVRYYCVQPYFHTKTTEDTSLMTRIAPISPSSPPSPPPKPCPSPLILPNPPLWSTGFPHCTHTDMTPLYGKSDLFRCDECWCKPASGRLYTCTQSVVTADGSIDARKKGFLDAGVRAAVNGGLYSREEVKVLIKQKLSAWNLARDLVPYFYPPRPPGPGYGTLYQGEEAKKCYLRKSCVREVEGGELFHCDEEVEEHTGTGEEQYPLTGDVSPYVAWLKTANNNQRHNEASEFASYIPCVDGAHDDPSCLQAVTHAQQQQNPNHQDQQTESRDRSYLQHTFDYHMAINDMYQISQHHENSRPRPQPHPPARSKTFRLPFRRFNKQDSPDRSAGVVRPEGVRPQGHRYSISLAGVPGTLAHGVTQTQSEESRGRSLLRRFKSHHRPAFVNVHQPDQKIPVSVPARQIGFIDKEQLFPERQTTTHGTPLSSYTSRPLPPLPSPPPRPTPPRPLYPCDYKICAACRGLSEDGDEVLPATRYHPDEDKQGQNGSNNNKPIHASSPHEQPIFFRPDFADPNTYPTLRAGVLMRDARYFLAREDPQLRNLVSRQSTIVDVDEYVPGGGEECREETGSGMDRPVTGSSRQSGDDYGDADDGTDDELDVDAGEQEVIQGCDPECA